MTLLTRMGFGEGYTATLPNGDHLTVWPDASAERVRVTPRKVMARPRAAAGCRVCSDPSQVCPDPAHRPVEELWKDTVVVARCLRQPTVAAALKVIAPGVDFGVRPDGSFPVRAYMRYTAADYRAWPRIKDDILEGVE